MRALVRARTIVAIDPAESKREAALWMGATHVGASWDEAPEVVREATWNRGADRFICTMGVGEGRLIEEALAMTAKRGELIVTNIHPMAAREVSVNMMDLTLTEKRIIGSLYGSANPRADIPNILELWGNGQVDLDAVVSRTYPLEKINDGYDDMRRGRNLHGVLRYPVADAAAQGQAALPRRVAPARWGSLRTSPHLGPVRSLFRHRC